MEFELNAYQLILGSRSPRRSELLQAAGLNFTIDPTDTDESFDASARASDIAEYLATKKAAAFRPLHEKEIYITCDTLVYAHGRVLNKPVDRSEAIAMISSLSGTTHEVFTGMCLRNKDALHSFHERTEVTFRKIPLEWIENYVDNEKPFDKAGAYGIQDWIGKVDIKRINGCYYNVMGLPVSRFIQELISFCAR